MHFFLSSLHLKFVMLKPHGFVPVTALLFFLSHRSGFAIGSNPGQAGTGRKEAPYTGTGGKRTRQEMVKA